MEPTTSPRTTQLSMTLTRQVVATLVLARGGSSCSRLGHFLRSGQASLPTALAAAIIGGSYHFSSEVRAVFESDETIASFTTDDKGRFQISLPPGHYTISKKDWKSHVGHYGPSRSM